MKWGATPTDWYTDLGLDEAGERAEVLHRRAWDFAGHQETGGFVPAAMVARLCPTHTKARVAALVRIGKWVEVEGGYQLAEWDDVYAELRSLLHRRKSDTERQRRHRAGQRDRDVTPDAARDVSAASTRDEEPDEERDETRDESRAVSRDSHALEERRDNPPTPPASRGDDKLIPADWTTGQCFRHRDKPGGNCKRCGTSPRQLAAAAAAAQTRAAEAELADLVERRESLDWCGDPDCDRYERRLMTERGLVKCPACHPDVVVGPLPRPALAVVPVLQPPRRAAGPAF